MPKAPRRPKPPGGRGQRNPRQQNRPDTSCRNINVTQRTARSWREPSDSTMKTFLECLDTNIDNALAACDVDIYTDVNDAMKEIKVRLKQSVSRMKLPPPKVKNYTETRRTVRRSQQLIEQNLDKSQMIDDALENCEGIIGELEQQIEELGGDEETQEAEEPEVNEEDRQRATDNFVRAISAMMKASP